MEDINTTRLPLWCWNLFECVQNNLPHTKTTIEVWHDAVAKRIGITHPTLRKQEK